MFSFNFYDDPVEEKDEKTHIEETEVSSIPLEEILAQLPDTLAYSLLGGLPRRELWHVKMQIMQNDEEEYLLGDSDVVKGSYEGGLKTWECSVDLADYLSQQSFPNELSVLEVLVCAIEAKTSSVVGRHCRRRCYSPVHYEIKDHRNLYCKTTTTYSTLLPFRICF